GTSVGPVLSGDGTVVAFNSVATNLVPGDTNGTVDVFVYDLRNGTTERVTTASDGTEANALSAMPALSADGRWVAFMSDAPTLGPGDTTQMSEIFIHDRAPGINERASLTFDGQQPQASDSTSKSIAPALTADGSQVVFVTTAYFMAPGVGTSPA